MTGNGERTTRRTKTGEEMVSATRRPKHRTGERNYAEAKDNNWRTRGAQDEIDDEHSYAEAKRQQLACTKCAGRNRNQTDFR